MLSDNLILILAVPVKIFVLRVKSIVPISSIFIHKFSVFIDRQAWLDITHTELSTNFCVFFFYFQLVWEVFLRKMNWSPNINFWKDYWNWHFRAVKSHSVFFWKYKIVVLESLGVSRYHAHRILREFLKIFIFNLYGSSLYEKFYF